MKNKVYMFVSHYPCHMQSVIHVFPNISNAIFTVILKYSLSFRASGFCNFMRSFYIW